MYRELRQNVRVEPLNLISEDLDRPTDILVPASTHGTTKHLALDVTMVSPDIMQPPLAC